MSLEERLEWALDKAAEARAVARSFAAGMSGRVGTHWRALARVIARTNTQTPVSELACCIYEELDELGQMGVAARGLVTVTDTPAGIAAALIRQAKGRK